MELRPYGLFRAQFRETHFSSSSLHFCNSTLSSFSAAITPSGHRHYISSGGAAPQFPTLYLSLSRLSPCHHTLPSLPPRSSDHRHGITSAGAALLFRAQPFRARPFRAPPSRFSGNCRPLFLQGKFSNSFLFRFPFCIY